MQFYKIEITREAQYDLDDAIDYIIYTLKQPNIALQCAEGIFKKINTLRIYPERYAVENDIKIKNVLGTELRKIIYKNYKIYYTIDENKKEVYILRIMHALRNI